MKRTVVLLVFILSLSSLSSQTQTVPAEIQQWIDREVFEATPKEPLDIRSDAFFDDTPARIVGYLQGYTPGSERPPGRIILENVFAKSRNPVLFEVEQDGRFAVNLPLKHPIQTYLWFGEEASADFYIEPGETLGIVIEWDKDKERASAFHGALADVNRELQLLEDSVKEPSPYYIYYVMDTISPMDFRASMDKRYDEYWAKLEQLSSQDTPVSYSSDKDDELPTIEDGELPVSRKALDIKKTSVLVLYAAKLMEYSMSKAESVALPASYYDFLAGLPLDNPQVLLSYNYEVFLNHLEFTQLFQKENLYADQSLTSAIIKVRSLRNTLKSIEDVNEKIAFAAGMKEQLTHPYLKRQADIITSQHLLELSGKAYELPGNEEAELFRKFIEAHRGKYIIVDLWEATCGYCLEDFKKDQEVREAHQDHPAIAFVHITNENHSPKERYDQIVEQYKLQHSYRIKSNDFIYLQSLFQATGVPRYILVDKEGRITDANYMRFRVFPQEAVEELLKN